ncbi:MAG: hypothetical protein Q8S55_09625 [Methylococcaceae bacterium]|nr:hypothetical protein [Methylococcaceae bacterium]
MLSLPKKTGIQGHPAINEERRAGRVGGFVEWDLRAARKSGRCAGASTAAAGQQ